MDGISIFAAVTENLSDLINSIKIRYQNGEGITVPSNDFDLLEPKPRTIYNRKYGRCYEITLNNKRSFFYIDVVVKQEVDIFFNLPHHFFTNSRQRIFASPRKNTYMPVRYEIQKTNHDPNCRKYSSSYAGSFDDCKTKDMELKLLSSLNCTVPFGLQTGRLCSDQQSEEASALYNKYYLTESPSCPRPCNDMVTIIGMPKYIYNGKILGIAKLYISNTVKVTEDFVSYDLLR